MTRDEVTAVIATAISENWWSEWCSDKDLAIADAFLAALNSAGLVIGERAMLTTADFEAWTVEWQDKDTGISEWFSEMPNGLALVRVIPNE